MTDRQTDRQTDTHTHTHTHRHTHTPPEWYIQKLTLALQHRWMWKRWVLSFVLKVVKHCVFLTDSGSEFQTVDPKTEKDVLVVSEVFHQNHTKYCCFGNLWRCLKGNHIRDLVPIILMKRPSSNPLQETMEAATPKLQPVWQPPQTEQTRAGYSVQAENWVQQTQCPHGQQVQGLWVWDVPIQCRHHDCRTSTTALPTTWCSEAGQGARTNTTEGQALSQPAASIMEAEDHQVTTVFTVQPSFHHRYSTNWISWSITIVGKRWGEVWLHIRWWW